MTRPWFLIDSPMTFDSRPTYAQMMDRAPKSARRSMEDGAFMVVTGRAGEVEDLNLRPVADHIMSTYMLAVEDMVEAYPERDSCALQVCANPEAGVFHRTKLMRGEVEIGRVTLRWSLGESPTIERTETRIETPRH